MKDYEISEEDVQRETLTPKKVTIIDVTEQEPNKKDGKEAD